LILVDTNVLLDVVTTDPHWAEWSQRQLEVLALQDRLVINGVIYAELAPAFLRIEELDAALAVSGIEIVDIPRAALYLAGRTFTIYRKRRGTKTGVLPDFFIGAHSAVAAIPLITRDTTRYRVYFPTVELIAPDT
jgi:predicted nucleic acid-binding protein